MSSTPAIQHVLNPTADVHIRIKLTHESALSAYDRVVVFLSDGTQSVASGQESSKAQSKRVDLSGAGNRANIDFKLSPAPSNGDTFIVSAILYDAEGTPINLDPLELITYYNAPIYNTHYKLHSLESKSRDGIGILKIKIEILPTENTPSISSFSFNIIRSRMNGSTKELTIYSKKIPYANLTVSNSNSNIIYYEIDQIDSSDPDLPDLQENDICEVSVYAENDGGQTFDVATETIKIDNAPSVISLDSYELRYRRVYSSSQVWDYVCEPTLEMKISYSSAGSISIQQIQSLKFEVIKDDELTKEIIFEDLGINSTYLNISFLNDPNKNGEYLIFDNGLKDKNGNSLGNFFQKNSTYTFKCTSVGSTLNSPKALLLENKKMITFNCIKKLSLNAPHSEDKFRMKDVTYRKTSDAITFTVSAKMELCKSDDMKNLTASLPIAGGNATCAFDKSENTISTTDGMRTMWTKAQNDGPKDDEYLLYVTYKTDEMNEAIGHKDLTIEFENPDVNNADNNHLSAPDDFDTGGGSGEYSEPSLPESIRSSSHYLSMAVRRHYYLGLYTYSISHVDERSETEDVIYFDMTKLGTSDGTITHYSEDSGNATSEFDATHGASEIYLEVMQETAGSGIVITEPINDDPDAVYFEFDYSGGISSHLKPGYTKESISGNLLYPVVWGKYEKSDRARQVSGAFFDTSDPTQSKQLCTTAAERYYIPNALVLTQNKDGTTYTFTLNPSAGYHIEKIWWIQSSSKGVVTSKFVFDNGVLDSEHETYYKMMEEVNDNEYKQFVVKKKDTTIHADAVYIIVTKKDFTDNLHMNDTHDPARIVKLSDLDV